MRPPFALWLTGLPCAGKSTLAQGLEKELRSRGFFPRLLDGDVLRRTLSSDLGYSPVDRRTHLRRVTEMTRSLVLAGTPAIVAVIAPYRAERAAARFRIGSFIEVYVRCPLAVCEARDVKGLYRRARRGEIAEFTGVTSPYEEPEQPDLIVDTDRMDIPSCLERILSFLEENGELEGLGRLVDRKKGTG